MTRTSLAGARLLQDSGPEGIDVERMYAGITRAQLSRSERREKSA